MGRWRIDAGTACGARRGAEGRTGGWGGWNLAQALCTHAQGLGKWPRVRTARCRQNHGTKGDGGKTDQNQKQSAGRVQMKR